MQADDFKFSGAGYPEDIAILIARLEALSNAKDLTHNKEKK